MWPHDGNRHFELCMAPVWLYMSSCVSNLCGRDRRKRRDIRKKREGERKERNKAEEKMWTVAFVRKSKCLIARSEKGVGVPAILQAKKVSIVLHFSVRWKKLILGWERVNHSPLPWILWINSNLDHHAQALSPQRPSRVVCMVISSVRPLWVGMTGRAEGHRARVDVKSPDRKLGRVRQSTALRHLR